MDKKQIDILITFKFGLIARFIEKKELIEWVDKQIENEIGSYEELIEISLSSNKSEKEIILLLNRLFGHDLTENSGKLILGTLCNKYKEAKLSITTLGKILYSLGGYDIYTEEENYQLFTLDDHIDLAVKGLAGKVEDAEKLVLEFLKNYEEYSINE